MTYDVLVAGEVLVEFSVPGPFRAGAAAELSFSGDALNAAAAAARAGAITGLISVVGDDEMGAALLKYVRELGISTDLVRLSDRPNGAYALSYDASGTREFTYYRSSSAGSSLSTEDLARLTPQVRSAATVVTSGITAALSPQSLDFCRELARECSTSDTALFYDPNHRGRLTTPGRTKAAFDDIAPHCFLVAPSVPTDSVALFGTDDVAATVEHCLAINPRLNVAVTCGSESLTWANAAGRTEFTVIPNPEVVDATGAGDIFLGTTAARYALGHPLETAVPFGAGAASASVVGRGGTGHLPSASEAERWIPAVRATSTNA